MQGPRRGEAAPARPTARTASRSRQPKTGHHHSRQHYTMAASARKPQARTRQQERHAMRSGIAARADAGTQAQQFNATPTPATALHAIRDHGAPRPLRQPGLQHASGSRGHCSRDAPALPGARGLPAPWPEHGKRMSGPRRGEAAPARPTAWRAARKQVPKTGQQSRQQRLLPAASARKP